MTRAQQPWFSGPDRAVGTRLRSNRTGRIRPGQRDVSSAMYEAYACWSVDAARKQHHAKRGSLMRLHSQKRDTKIGPQRPTPKSGLRPRFCDTETGPYAAYAPCPLGFCAKPQSYAKTKT